MDDRPPPRVTPERWERIAQIFHGALDLAEPDRMPFVSAACGDDDALREDITALLSAHAEGPLDQLQAEVPRRIRVALPAEPAPGARVGAYRLVDRIGHGGMGIVYLAERDDPELPQRVALKLLRSGVDATELIGRFLTERRILARLQHPNITRLLDGGITPGGVPFFAMEHVDGLPIHRYCDRERLAVRERLALFLGVCDAMQYAHRHLVVHRDVKPSNVLVTRDGTVKVLDFGIAKLLDEQEGAGGQTGTGQRRMTPEYASPEQVRGEPVTTASDVYALGVVLYELLTGRRPYDVERRSRHDVERAVLESEPSKPSAAVTRPAPEGQPVPEQVGAVRCAPPAKLRRQLTGDLDTIVLKAIDKEPERRYAMAGELANDLRRHLAGLPVRARPDTLRYRTAKFVRRHRIGVAAALAVFVSLVGGLSTAAWQALEARGHARVATMERDNARREAAKAADISTFLIDLFRMADPSRSRGETITARELLDRGARRIEEEMADQPELQATVMAVIGQVYQSLGLYAPAEELLDGALARQRELYGDLHPEVAATLASVGALEEEQSNYESAERSLREALAIRRSAYGSEHADVAASLHDLGRVLSETQDWAGARELLEEALEIRRRVLGARHPHVGETLYELALVIDREGDHATARQLFRQAVDVPVEVGRNPTPATARRLAALARVLHFSREYERAQPLYEQALALRRRIYRETHPDLAASLNDLARLLRDLGDYEAAEPLARRALAMWRELFPGDHREVSISLAVLADLLKQKAELREAEALFRSALAMRIRLWGTSHASVIGARRSLAGLLVERGKLQEAGALYRQVLTDTRELHGADHYYVAEALAGVGRLREKMRNRSDADSLYREALATADRALRRGHPVRADYLLALAELRHAAGNCTRAEPLYREALEVRRGGLPPDHWRVMEAASALGACFIRQGRYAAAEPLLRETHETLEHTGRGPAALRRANLERLVELYERWGKNQTVARYRAMRDSAPH